MYVAVVCAGYSGILQRQWRVSMASSSYCKAVAKMCSEVRGAWPGLWGELSREALLNVSEVLPTRNALHTTAMVKQKAVERVA